MNAADLVRATIAGEATPRPAYAFWTHFPGIDLDPDAIALATLEFARATRADFVKSMPNGLYAVEDWGVRADFSEIAAGGAARVAATPIRMASDWTAVRRLDPRAGALGRELRHLALLVEATEVPVLATVFSPITTAKKLAGGDIATHDPKLLQPALAEIAATTADFAAEAIAMGCAGVFFAAQDATLTTGEAVYREAFLEHDLAALEGARAGWFNAVHMHGEEVLFDLLAALPVQVLNWHIGDMPPSIAAYRAGGGRKPILGGLRRTPLTQRDMAAVEQDLAAIRAADGGRGVLVSPGCVIRHPVDLALLASVAARIRGES